MLPCSCCASSPYGILNRNPKINMLSAGKEKKKKKVGHNK